MIRKGISAVVILIALFLIIGIVYENVSSPPVGVNQGEKAPDIEFAQKDTSETRNLSDDQGQFVIMNLWASWCEPCIRELPLLSDLHEEYQEMGATVLAVNVTTYERTQDDAREFLRDHPVNMPVLFDTEGELSDTYPIQYLPTTYLINEQGIIVDIIVGEVTEDMMAERIEPFLSDKDVSHG